MADIKIASMVEATSITDTDLIVVEDSADTKKITKANFFKMIYPVGSIYLSVNSTNPSSLFGGSWIVFGAGRTLVGIDTSQSEFDVVEETGGNLTHRHTSNVGYAGGRVYITTDGTESGTEVDSYYSAVMTSSPANSRRGYTLNSSSLQPYIVTYIWKRTA